MTKVLSLTIGKKYLPYYELILLRDKKSTADEICKAIKFYTKSDKQIILPKDMRNLSKLNDEDLRELMKEISSLNDDVFAEWIKRK